MNPNVRKSLIWSGVIAAASAIGYGIYLFYKRQIGLAMQYCYKISGLKFLKIEKDNISIQLNIKIQNRSDFTVEIKGYDFDIYLNDKKIANVISNKSEMLLGNAISELTFVASCNPQQIFDKEYIAKLISYAITDRRRITIKVVGLINAQMNFVSLKKLKFDYETTAYDIINAPPTEKIKCDIM